MAEPACPESRYAAFLSYSHKDAAAAGRLHRRLETYRLPKRLAGSETARGVVPDRLWPIFRDREELPAATDLSETVREALAQSGALIVLCSPHSAESLWVAEEIETFRRLHLERPILAAILDGDPPDCFPAMLRAYGTDGTWHEPLATDLRRGRDGAQLGLLKLVAGITGVGLDALVQRDAARRIRRVMAVTVVVALAALIMAALTWFALQASREAEQQRAEAERQIEFMLTDLRARLRGVGRLDIMTAVNRQALNYYGRQEMNDLSPDSLDRRARVLHAMGEDDLIRDNMQSARLFFREAHRTTAEQLARGPDNPDRILAHSQSEFYIGNFSYERGDYQTALRAFERYRALADRLVAIDSRNAAWLKEAAFAEGSLCTVILEGLHDIPAALRSCAVALGRMEEAARVSRNISDYRSDLANRHGYVADALLAAGRPAEALRHQERRLAYLVRQLSDDPDNARLRARRVWALRGLARVEAGLGRPAQATTHMLAAIVQLEPLITLDGSNADWQRQLGEMRIELEHMRLERTRR